MRTLSFFAENIREAKHGRGGLSISDSRAGAFQLGNLPITPMRMGKHLE